MSCHPSGQGNGGGLKRTPLYELHKRLGAKLVEFGGWEMPVPYTSIMDEHLAVRKAAGIFDISHMGQVMVSGSEPESFLNRTLTNDVRKLAVGQGQYTLMCNEHGGVIDDLYVYREARSLYILVVNASRTETDLAWLQKQLTSDPDYGTFELKNISEKWGAVAVQGPRVVEFIDQCFPGESISWPGTSIRRVSELKKNEIRLFRFSNTSVHISRTGYTGEDGFEVLAPAQLVAEVWSKLLVAGHPFCLQPAGLGARDTLRSEVCYPLYGNDLNEATTPIEAGLGFFVALDKGEFIGRAKLAEQKEKGIARKLVAFKMTDKSAPPRPHYLIWSATVADGAIGEVSSGTQSPSLGIGIGMGYVKADFAKPGALIDIEIRGKRAPAIVIQKPFYRKS